MNRLIRTLLIAASLISTAIPRPSGAVHVDVNVAIPAPPAVVFTTRPEVVVIPQTHVYYVPSATEYDMYQFGPYWYINRGGYWYRSSAYGGPFHYVEYRSVPRPIVSVPAGYRHHPLYPHGGHPRHVAYRHVTHQHGKHHSHHHHHHHHQHI